MKKQILSFVFAMGAVCGMAQERTFLPPTMGWSSWNTYHTEISQDLIKSQADAAVAKGLLDAGYNYINIDDCFQNNRDAAGNLQINDRFPNMRALVDYIHSLGLKAGIYSDAGTKTCAYRWQNHTTYPVVLGGEKAGLYQHEAADCELFFNTLDFDFIKVDYCGAEDLDLKQQERYTTIGNAIKAATPEGKRVAYNMCCWRFPGAWAADVADSWRTTGDIVSKWSENPSTNITTDAMKGVKEIIKENLYLSGFCGGGHYNDMDMLEVGVTRDGTLTADESFTHFAMWCIMTSPLLIGADLTILSDEDKALLTNPELIAINQDVLGLQAYVVKASNGTYVLTKDVETLHGKKRAVAFYNPTDAAKTMSVNFSEVDLDGSVAVRDLGTRTDVGTYTTSYEVEVPAHGTKIYTFEAEKRLVRTLYEAETAWLGGYQEIHNNQGTGLSDCPISAVFGEKTACSGGVYVGWLGKSEKNDLQWRDVYVAEEGDYEVVISVRANQDRDFSLSVNGGEAVTVSGNSGSWNDFAEKTVTIHLGAGSNTVRLSRASGDMPDIDYMRINIEPQEIIPTCVGAATAACPSHAYNVQGMQVPATQRGLLIQDGKVRVNN